MGSAPDNAAFRATLGSYRLLGEVGRDPLGVLFLACPAGARTFPKWALVRRMHPGLARDPAMAQAFLAATQAAIRMVHRNIASTFDFGGKGALPWAAREHLSGASAIDVVASLVTQKARMPWPLAGYLIAEAADGVSALRAKLPDYGPPMGFLSGTAAASVFVTRTGEVKIVDGCLPLIDGEPVVDSLALPYRPAGLAKGSSAAGARDEKRADAFGLGVLLWELVAGRRLFLGKDDAETARLVEGGVVPPVRAQSSAPPLLDDLIRRSLGQIPAGGGAPLASAAELATALRSGLRSEGRLADASDVARTMADMFATALKEQDTAVEQAWQRERALQAIGELPPEVLSETDLTIPLGQTVQDTTTETTVALRGKRSMGGDAFDEIPTVPRGGANLLAGSSWRARAQPSGGASPDRLSAPRIDYLVAEETPTVVALPETTPAAGVAKADLRDSVPEATEVWTRVAAIPHRAEGADSAPESAPGPTEVWSRSAPVPEPSDSGGATEVFMRPGTGESRAARPSAPPAPAPRVEARRADLPPDSEPDATEVWMRRSIPAPLPAPLPVPLPPPRSPPRAVSAPPPPPPQRTVELPGLFESESELDEDRERRPPVMVEPVSDVAIPLLLPPVERPGITPLSERRPFRREPLTPQLATPAPGRRRVSRRQSMLVAGGIGFTLSCVVIACVGWYLRFADESETATPGAPSGVTGSPSPKTPVAASPSPRPRPSTAPRVAADPWTPVGASASAAPSAAPAPAPSLTAVPVTDLPPAPADRPRAPSPGRSHRTHAAPPPTDDTPPPASPPVSGGGKTGLLSVFCTPACDQVYDGSRALGPSPVFKVPTSAGTHRLRLRVDSGKLEKTVTVNVAEDDTTVVRETLGE